MVPDQKLFYNQKITFLFEFKFSSKSSQNKNSIDSPPPPPLLNPNPDHVEIDRQSINYTRFELDVQ